VRAERELPVVWAVAKGSFRNKLILVPAALLISAIAPWLITPLLMLGGAFLCFEGFEKLAHKYLHSAEEDAAAHQAELNALANPDIDLVAFEQEKIKGAIRTDFILSAEIIVIALGTVKDAAFASQVSVVAGIAVIMTIGVYGLVAGIVKLDDAGYYLLQTQNRINQAVGRGLLKLAPHLMKSLAVVGTAAMFLVGGGILLHGLPLAHDLLHNAEHAAASVPAIGGLLAALTPSLINATAGVLAGALVLAGVTLVGKLFGKTHGKAA
jgi:predicted DNA repair protein MutK